MSKTTLYQDKKTKQNKSTVTLKTYSSGINLRPSENSTQINQGQVKIIDKIPKTLSVVEANLAR